MRELTIAEIEGVSGGLGQIIFFEGSQFSGAGYSFSLDGTEFDGRTILVATGGHDVNSFTNDIIVTANRDITDLSWFDIDSYVPSHGGFIGGNIAGLISTPPPPPPIQFDGRQCPADKDAAHKAVNDLYNGSPTAHAAIDAAFAAGVGVTLFRSDYSGFGQTDDFGNPGTPNKIDWDPFSTVNGYNNDGTTTYSESPLMALAHEFVHAAHPELRGAASEIQVMAITNQIAAEMNANTGSHYETTRNKHTGQLSQTNSVNSQTFGFRQDCP